MKRSIDWPPTSKERPGLVAYGAPRKLPRLDEGPYVDVWTNVVRQAVEEHKKRWKKIAMFSEVHAELRHNVERCAPEGLGSRSGSLYVIHFYRRRRRGPVNKLYGTCIVGRQRTINLRHAVPMWKLVKRRGACQSFEERLMWDCGENEEWAVTDIYGKSIRRCVDERAWRAEIQWSLRKPIRLDCECGPCQDGRPWQAAHLRRHFLDMAPKEFDFGHAKAKMEECCSEYEVDFTKKVDRGDLADVVMI